MRPRTHPTTDTEKIEDIAEGLLDRHDARTIPVPVTRIAEALDIRVARNHGPDTVVASFVVDHGSGVRILGVNTAVSPRRERFATAHGIGHLVLDHVGRRRRTDPDDMMIICPWFSTDPEPVRDEEAAATIFAGGLLMPAREFLQELDLQVENRHPSRDALIAAIAQRFEVSIEACGWRLMQLGAWIG